MRTCGLSLPTPHWFTLLTGRGLTLSLRSIAATFLFIVPLANDRFVLCRDRACAHRMTPPNLVSYLSHLAIQAVQRALSERKASRQGERCAILQSRRRFVALLLECRAQKIMCLE